ncbi:hypothetical protein [Streptomyces sp. NPDC053431]|uniref:hypothetical protein n=1 Tax=Streptomyces sp. NPDC053431 TaxID=3365703 RepID=UPI0037D2DC02
MLDEAHQALEQAKETGRRVEVQSERGERTTVFANPDGFTRADGTVGPKAASAEMSFSDGSGDGPLVKISDQGRSLELGWKGDLPGHFLPSSDSLEIGKEAFAAAGVHF